MLNAPIPVGWGGGRGEAGGGGRICRTNTDTRSRHKKGGGGGGPQRESVMSQYMSFSLMSMHEWTRVGGRQSANIFLCVLTCSSRFLVMVLSFFHPFCVIINAACSLCHQESVYPPAEPCTESNNKHHQHPIHSICQPCCATILFI
jgi:hypothetical protein